MISTFDDLLLAAHQQPDAQRLLFVFAGTELPADSTSEQRASYQSGSGGALVPLMTADKTPAELTSFSDLAEESRQFGKSWAIVFVACLDGQGSRAPTSAEAEKPLTRMVEAIKAGSLGSFIPFNRQGQTVAIS